MSDADAAAVELLGDSNTEFDIARRRRIYCNRNLRMDSIDMVGFDMDYTLALYHQDRLEALSVRLTLDNMIKLYGYPEAVRNLHYDPSWAIRGIVVDRELGNIFKMDRHAHVGRCFHGFRKLTRDERKAVYRNEKINLSADRYEWIDTLFGLPEAVMYATLVDWYDASGTKVDYHKLFNDIRASIDLAHRDDSLKSIIKADLASYIIKDDQLAETLHKLRSSGKKLFLLTNSLYDYTDAVMTYLLGDAMTAYPSWRQYFDIVIVGGAKPAFFNRQNPFAQVDIETGQPLAVEVKSFVRDRVYQGGNSQQLEEFTKVTGDRVLYIGDHIYGDILRLRKSHTWRTAMVLQELDREVAVSERFEGPIRDLELLDRRRRNLESEMDFQTLRYKRIVRTVEDPEGISAATVARLEETRRTLKATIDRLKERMELMSEEVTSLQAMIEHGYNPHWGSCLREANEGSRFGEQVNDHADIYTSRVSNFLFYSPLRYFRAPRRLMPHEV